MMNRRDFIRLGGSSLLFAGMPGPLRAMAGRSGDGHMLFYRSDDLAQIRANARSELLAPMYREWASLDASEIVGTMREFADTLQFLSGGNRPALNALMHGCVAQMVSPTRERSRAIRESMRLLIQVPQWDFYREAETTPLGTLRNSAAIVNLLLARQVVADDLDEDFDKEIMQAIIEKGCVPCHRALYGMDNPESVQGWGFDEMHRDMTVLDLDLSRWPMILGANNFRGVIASALGTAAIAVGDRDSRSEEWLERSVNSMDRVMLLFERDGSFFEGISYADYTLRSAFAFFDVHERRLGTIKWNERYDFDPFIDHFLTMQLGKDADGSPDWVNFSDARGGNVTPGTASWIGRQTGNPLAQYVAENTSVPRFFQDFIWYDGGRPSKAPPLALRNVRNDLDWVLCRTGWGADDTVVAFRSGGPANHEHADRNHLILKAHGERLLHDYFNASYDRHHPLWLLRESEAHNTVHIGGRGQHYHDGSEGTNDSLSYANITRYEDAGHVVWWTSDATAAYRIDNYHIFKVLRTAIFMKPDIVVLLDQVQLRYWPQDLEIRFFPDNSDGAAVLDTAGASDRFRIGRPMASLHGQVFSHDPVEVSGQKLDIPEEHGAYPYLRIKTGEGLRHEVLTVLTASGDPAGAQIPRHRVESTADGWRVHAGRLNAKIITSGQDPLVKFI
ncbi:MAG: heparinase II/III family protein [Opitutales bacterium]|nr:heparinase II/III family protein [Opitutales bacterium]